MTNAKHYPRMSLTATGLILVAALILARPVSAQTPTVTALTPEPEAFTFTPFIGSGFAGDLENTPVDFGAALGYGYNNRVSFEGELGFAPSVTQGDLVQFDTNYWTLSGNVLYHFLQPQFTPYVTLGLGVVGSSPDNINVSDFLGTDEDSTTTFAWNYGAGVKAALNNRFGVRGDLRYFNASQVAPDHFRIYAGLVIRRIGQ